MRERERDRKEKKRKDVKKRHRTVYSVFQIFRPLKGIRLIQDEERQTDERQRNMFTETYRHTEKKKEIEVIELYEDRKKQIRND